MSLRAATVAASLAGLPFMLPHVLEDFGEGIAQRVGLTPAAGAFLLGLYMAVQFGALALVARDRRGGWIVTCAVSAIWTAGAVIDHGPAILAGGFRSGALSVVWALGLIASQGATAILAWRGWRAR